MGGREVLHAAISADEGQTWRGFREIFREAPGPLRGDRGTAYASLVENAAGKIIVVSGQGEGRRALFAWDPRWLEASAASADLRARPLAWTNYGGPGLHVITRDDSTRALALPFTRTAPQGALWNFPMTMRSEEHTSEPQSHREVVCRIIVAQTNVIARAVDLDLDSYC